MEEGLYILAAIWLILEEILEVVKRDRNKRSRTRLRLIRGR